MKRSEMLRRKVQLPLLNDCRSCPEFGFALEHPEAYGMEARDQVAAFVLVTCQGRSSALGPDGKPTYSNYEEYLAQLCEPGLQLELENAAQNMARFIPDMSIEEARERVAL